MQSLIRFFHRRAWHQQRAAELDAYLAAEAADNRERGLSPAAAHHAAERKLGNRTRILEDIYEANSLAWVETLTRDVRYAARRLVHARALSLAAIAILALGIGANTAMFTLVHAELRPLPFPRSDRLVAVLETSPGLPQLAVSYPDYLDWQSGNHSFSDLAALRGSNMILTHRGTPAMVVGMRVSANYFRTLGGTPALGRDFLPSEDQPGGPDVVIASDQFWRERLGADPAALGQPIELDGRARILVGVMPPGFPGLEPGARRSQFWTPLGAYASENPAYLNRASHAGTLVIGRLRDAVSLAAARDDLAALAAQLARDHPATNTGTGVVLQSYLDLMVGDTRPGLLFLMAAVGLVLLIACANVASLLLARAATRQREQALRLALGASRARLIRESLLEAFGLALAGCALGLPLCWLCLRAAPALLPTPLPRALPLTTDATALVFAASAALLTSLLCGVIPALAAGRAGIAAILKRDAPASTGAGPGGRARSALVVVEMALALMLLLGAGFMVASLTRLQRLPLGIAPHGVLTFTAGLPASQYPDPPSQSAFFRAALARLAAVPGVRSAAGVFPLPFGGSVWQPAFTIAGRPALPPGRELVANLAIVRGDYFLTLGITRLRGRDFNPGDTAASPAVAIVDDAFVAHNWPTGADAALGSQVILDGVARTIIGIVGRVNGFDPDPAAALGQIYIPQQQSRRNTNVLSFVLRTGLAQPAALRPALLSALAQVDSDQPVTDMVTLDAQLNTLLAVRRHALALLAVFALLALTLAATGVYGVMAYNVVQRRHDIGVRMALGASPRQVQRLVLGQGLRLALLGAALGLAAAFACARWAAALLPGFHPNDAATLATMPLGLLLISALACYLPARRATRVDPLLALRSE